jgi:hypothetical protein
MVKNRASRSARTAVFVAASIASMPAKELNRSRGSAHPVEQHPRYRDAVAQRNEAARQLDHTVVKAPFAGIVTNVPSIAPGKYLQASMNRPRIQQRGCHRASPPSMGVRKCPAQLGRGRGGKFRPGQGDRTRHKRRRDTCPLGLPWKFDPRMKLNTG